MMCITGYNRIKAVNKMNVDTFIMHATKLKIYIGTDQSVEKQPHWQSVRILKCHKKHLLVVFTAKDSVSTCNFHIKRMTKLLPAQIKFSGGYLPFQSKATHCLAYNLCTHTYPYMFTCTRYLTQWNIQSIYASAYNFQLFFIHTATFCHHFSTASMDALRMGL